MLRIDAIEITLSGKQLLDSVSYQFPSREKIALIGKNGVGKSTLLKILTKETLPDAGSVFISQNLRLGFLPQEPNAHPEKTVLQECMAASEKHYKKLQKLEIFQKESQNSEADFSSYTEDFSDSEIHNLEARAATILKGLGFSKEQETSDPQALSGGWRMRLELARILLDAPDYLILDEPTNHLDLPSLLWVEKFLEKFRGTLIFVSHDKDFINRLATTVVELASGSLKAYPGNYEQFIRISTEHKILQEKTFKKMNEKQKHLQGFVDRFSAKASKAKQAQSKLKQVEKIAAQKNSLAPLEVKSKKVLWKNDEIIKSGRVVFELKNIEIGYPNKPLKELELLIERGQKVAIVGGNGLGKTTLLKTLAGKIAPLTGSIKTCQKASLAYFTQDQREFLEPSLSVLEHLLKKTLLGEPAARSLLARFLFGPKDLDKQAKVLSGGEKTRLALALLLATKPNTLLLDEPTNHLDLESSESLAEYLAQYPGTILFVSHNRFFINQVASHTLALFKDVKNSYLLEGNLESSNINLSDFIEEKKNLQKNQSSSEKNKSEKYFKELKKKRQKVLKKLQDFEKKTAQIEHELKEVEKEMCEFSEGSKHDMIFDLQVKEESLKETKEACEEKWLELCDEKEALEKKLEDFARKY